MKSLGGQNLLWGSMKERKNNTSSFMVIEKLNLVRYGDGME